MADDGLRYRGHKHADDGASGGGGSDFALSHKSTNDDSVSRRRLSEKRSTSKSSPVANGGTPPRTSRDTDSLMRSLIGSSNKDDDAVACQKPLLSRDDSDGSTTALQPMDVASGPGGTMARADSSNSQVDGGSSTCGAAESGSGMFASVVALARKAKCKVLDKINIKYAKRFAVLPPPEPRLKILRRYLQVHVQPVAHANAHENGQKKREPHHHDMLAALWERLNTRAPRCVRRKANDPDGADVDPRTLVGNAWASFGFQQKEPASDLRGAGSLAVEHLLFLVTRFPRLLERIAPTPPDNADFTKSYPFAAASINVTMHLIDLLRSAGEATADGKDAEVAAKNTTGSFHVGTFSAMEARRRLAHMLTEPNSNHLFVPGSPTAFAPSSSSSSSSSSSAAAAPSRGIVLDDVDGSSPPAASRLRNASFSAQTQNLPWTSTHFKKRRQSGQKALDAVFGDDVLWSRDDTASKNSASKPSAASSSSSAGNSNAVSAAAAAADAAFAAGPLTAKGASATAAAAALALTSTLDPHMPANEQEERELEVISERLAAVHVACICMLHDEWLRGKRNVLYFSSETFKQFAARLELLLRDSVHFHQVMQQIQE